MMNTRSPPRVSRSAARKWCNQANIDFAGGMPSRRRREAATSSGLRTTITKPALMRIRSSTSHQMGTKRHILGSLTTKSGAPSNSSEIVSSRRAEKPAAASDWDQSLEKPVASSHEDPAASSISSCSWRRTSDSQKPASLFPSSGMPPAGSMRFFGNAAPRRLSTRETAEVPLRCIPRMMIAVLRWV